MVHFIQSGFLENLGDVVIPFLSSLFSKIGILVSCLRLTCKGSLDIFFGFTHFDSPLYIFFILCHDYAIFETPFLAAFFAQAVQDDSFREHGEVILDMIRDPQVIEFIATKIYDLSTIETMKMMMFVHVRVKTPRPTLGWDDIDQADLRKRQQCPVYRVIGYVGKFFFHDVEHFIGCGMIFCPHELFVNRTALWSDLQIEIFADLYERVKAIGNLMFLHIIIK